MTGIFGKQQARGTSRCARCHRPFTPRKEGDRYGPKCARKEAAQQRLDALAEVNSAYREQQRRYDGFDPKEV